GGPHRLVATVVDEVGAEQLVATADECIVAVPLVDAEVLVEVVRDRVPRYPLPTHALLQPLDVPLRRARAEHDRGVAALQVRHVADVVGYHGAADAGVL